MHPDTITIRLGLSGLVVVETKEGEAVIEVVARYEAQGAPCPRCGCFSARVHQWHRQRKRDAKVWGKVVWLLVWKRRFRCPSCHKAFIEPDPACGRYRRTTGRLRREAAVGAEEASVRAVASWQGVSEGLVQRSWVEAHLAPVCQGAPRFMGMDGFCVARPGRMWTGLWDLEERAPLALVPGERQRDVQLALEGLAHPEAVQAVVIDLAEPYRQAVQMALPQAAVVADKFHVIALAGRALREVRRGRRGRGNVAALLDRGVERLRPREREQLAEALSHQPELARAWALKEWLRRLYHRSSPIVAARDLDAWREAAHTSDLAPFQRLAGTVGRWREEILNYWRFPLTNAFVEGKHNRVKVLKRRAYGYRNQTTFTLRILNLVHTD